MKKFSKAFSMAWLCAVNGLVGYFIYQKAGLPGFGFWMLMCVLSGSIFGVAFESTK